LKNLQPQTATPAASGVYRFGAAVAVFIVLITSTYLWLDRQATLDREQARGELLTRILFNHVTRTLESTTSLMTVANQWSESTSPSQEKLRSAIENSSFIRSMSMVSESGVVLASSEEGVVNQTLDWKSLGLDRDVGKDLAAGRWQPARNLFDLNRGSVGLTDIAVLPLSLRMQRADGQVVRWLVLINPGDLINGFAESVNATCDAVYVFDFAGRILASSSERWFPNDQLFPEMPAVKAVANNQEYGRYLGKQYDIHQKLEKLEVHFRTSASLPVTVAVAVSRSRVELEWWLSSKGIIGMSLFMLVATFLSHPTNCKHLAAQRRRSIGHVGCFECCRGCQSSQVFIFGADEP
jgi:hypothetical protein